MRTALSVVLTLWPPGPDGAEDVDLEVLRLDLDIDFLRLGQHRDRGGRGVDASLGFGRRHPLHPVHPRFPAQQAVGSVAPDREMASLMPPRCPVAHADRLDVKPVPLGESGVHA